MIKTVWEVHVTRLGAERNALQQWVYRANGRVGRSQIKIDGWGGGGGMDHTNADGTLFAREQIVADGQQTKHPIFHATNGNGRVVDACG